MKKVIKSEKEMGKLAEELACVEARVFGLVGELGAGKTTFAKAFFKALGVKRIITSPTFLIMRRYPLKNKNVYHLDAYRVNNTKDLMVLGIEDILKDENSLVLVEWADKVREILPEETFWISFHHGVKKNERMVSYSKK